MSPTQRLMVQMTMRDFLSYCKNGAAKDLEPLDVFEMSIPEAIEADFNVPAYFRDDAWDALPDFIRPPWRWLLVGPARSGTPFHVDPMATSAWNVCLEG